jgi:hypothetical protein
VRSASRGLIAAVYRGGEHGTSNRTPTPNAMKAVVSSR